MYSRRKFIATTTSLTVAGVLMPDLLLSGMHDDKGEKDLHISLAQWSLHRTLRSGKLDHLEFPAKAVEDFDIHAVEYVNAFFKDKATDKRYLDEMNKRCADLDVRQLLIMVDGEGSLATLDRNKRQQAIENHYKWVEAAKYLGCHSIRVNAYGQGSPEDVRAAAIDSLGRLAAFAAPFGINVIVENHGGYSSDGKWLSGVMASIDRENCGTLPDFGNFCLKKEHGECVESYDRYQGVRELLPYAKAVSAKSYDFNSSGEETTIDFAQMISLVRKAGYKGYIGVEYEGKKLDEDAGIRATRALLDRLI